MSRDIIPGESLGVPARLLFAASQDGLFFVRPAICFDLGREVLANSTCADRYPLPYPWPEQ